MDEPSPEQTASLFSLAFYTFLDPIVSMASGVPHLSADQLPPLSDYDYAKNLKKNAFSVSSFRPRNPSVKSLPSISTRSPLGKGSAIYFLD
jgi:hypothetical protein